MGRSCRFRFRAWFTLGASDPARRARIRAWLRLGSSVVLGFPSGFSGFQSGRAPFLASARPRSGFSSYRPRPAHSEGGPLSRCRSLMMLSAAGRGAIRPQPWGALRCIAFRTVRVWSLRGAGGVPGGIVLALAAGVVVFMGPCRAWRPLGPLGASLRALRGGPWSASRSRWPTPSHTAHGGRGAVLPALARFSMSGASLRAPAVWSAAPVPTGGGLSELAASLEPSARPQRPHRRYSLPRYVGAVPRVRSRSETRGAIGSCAAVRADCQRSGASMPPAGHQPDAQRGACPAKGMPRCGSA